DNLCRSVALHPKWPTAYLPHIRSRVTGFDARGSIFAMLSVCDLGSASAKEPERRRPHTVDSFNSVLVASNAWESVVSPDGSRMYTVYAGTDDLTLFHPLDDHSRDAQPIGRPIPVGKHPRAIRVSPDGAEVYVYNTLDFEVAVFDPDVRKKLAAVKVCSPPH